ncbi:UDP-3-O-[3-hydroxymyristoyl] N-acetylglucosamine deacetylase [Thecamonas trahens ATCC 50062]|uniref:UDP-3-O-acyl-N-acetylglucosamine deacetylase n=1 Tax=Thecamonas trahens ATCC 50062 TaxID=461836 RepID=A0A0L0D2F4_THETB|nr:UDP-3-O-[3-hydroxymyristoyl] N-acetylglucosamine deacetylase [Thecamonas trahens ATCC 50062]KNC46509.1 UDP-3-O-[3-hydroxymyristoyl] N-acetylglucosamine deacetylase [Thecamonas trahens ATCC 50062]|eukprot:XP_013760290.1 UDP-3-O-[3-hydroxymyristoyl] N-acetylglucosamine deacetylase [Thecamonas trahens ATCC 50062]
MTPLAPALVSETTLATTLSIGRCSVATVEHMMSALVGSGIDAAIIEIEANQGADTVEMPILDGSASEWVQAIASCGRAELSGDTSSATCALLAPLDRPLRVDDPKGTNGFIAYSPGAAADPDVCSLDVSVVYPALGKQQLCWDFDPWTEAGRAAYAADIAPARTFTFESELDALRAAGLAAGGSLHNALVYTASGALYSDQSRDMLRFPDDEAVRHKTLDLIGDLTLAPAAFHRLRGGVVVAHKPGHALNVAFAAALAAL